MKKLLLLLTMPVLLFSCSKEESINGLGTEVETKTITPAVGYESPYDLNNLDPFFPIKFINNTTDYSMNFRVSTIAGYYDGNWDGVIDYSLFGGPVLDAVNYPLLNEGYLDIWTQSVGVGPMDADNYSINSFLYYSRPYNMLEKSFLTKYSKLIALNSVITNTTTNENVFQGWLKHDQPDSFTDMDNLPTDMSMENYYVIPGAKAYNLSTGQLMGIVAYHKISGEIIWPEMPDFTSEYFFTEPGGPALHLYFKTFADHIEIVLE